MPSGSGDVGPSILGVMTTTFLKDAFGWGVVLWLIGYVLGILLFAVVPPAALGWVIMPIGIVITLWILLKKIHGGSLTQYLGIAVAWTLIAVVLDYFLLVQVLHPADGYYKLDVYLYYILTFLLPVSVGWWKQSH